MKSALLVCFISCLLLATASATVASTKMASSQDDHHQDHDHLPVMSQEELQQRGYEADAAISGVMAELRIDAKSMQAAFSCPDGYPQDCGGGLCCPNNTECCTKSTLCCAKGHKCNGDGKCVKKLSAGQIVGIVFGVIIGVAILLALAFIIFMLCCFPRI